MNHTHNGVAPWAMYTCVRDHGGQPHGRMAGLYTGWCARHGGEGSEAHAKPVFKRKTRFRTYLHCDKVRHHAILSLQECRTVIVYNEDAATLAVRFPPGGASKFVSARVKVE